MDSVNQKYASNMYICKFKNQKKEKKIKMEETME